MENPTRKMIEFSFVFITKPSDITRAQTHAYTGLIPTKYKERRGRVRGKNGGRRGKEERNKAKLITLRH